MINRDRDFVPDVVHVPGPNKVPGYVTRLHVMYIILNVNIHNYLAINKLLFQRQKEKKTMP